MSEILCPHCVEYHIPDCGVPHCEHDFEIAKLQAELDAATLARVVISDQLLKLDKLQAVVDMTREILAEAEDYEKRTGKAITWLNNLRDAIKEVGDE